MRIVLTVSAGAVALMLAPLPAFANHNTAHSIPTGAQAERDPCAAVANSPHEPASLKALQARCRHLRAQLSADPGNAALREECDKAARALTGKPC